MSYVKHYCGPRKQDLTTPRSFFDELNARFSFTLDGAARKHNALLPRYSTKASPAEWRSERVFCNPPWSNIPYFVELGVHAEVAVLLVPARVNCKCFHRALDLGAKASYFKGKLKFGKSKWNSPVDCLLLVFNELTTGTGVEG